MNSCSALPFPSPHRLKTKFKLLIYPHLITQGPESQSIAHVFLDLVNCIHRLIAADGPQQPGVSDKI